MQIVLQAERGLYFNCTGFRGLPIVQPCQIVLGTARYSAQERRQVELLERMLTDHLLSTGSAVGQVEPPCGGRTIPVGCHAFDEPDCRKLLVLVCDGDAPLRASHPAVRWLQAGHEVLPILPAGASVGSLMPAALSGINACLIHSSVGEALSSIFVRAGLVPEESRIFISYRRDETQGLAEQLFGALSRENFEVFVDRFSLPPGVDVQARLSQELQDKSMVLVLESASILSSPWTSFEINFARLRRLGRMALHLPGGAKIPDLHDRHRLSLTASDLGSGNMATPWAIANVVQRVKAEHDRALLWRRRILRESVVKAAWLHGLNPICQPGGVIRIDGGASGQTAVWTSPRSPEVTDYREAHAARLTAAHALLIAPSAYSTWPRRADYDWLSSVSQVRTFDEGAILTAVDAIARGWL